MNTPTFKVGLGILAFPPITLLLFCAAFYVFGVRPWDSGIVASMSFPDGSKVMVTQTYNVWTEPYEVRLWHKRPGKSWQAGYVDHQSASWRNAVMTLDREKDSIAVTEGGVRRIVLNVAEGTFWLDNGSLKRKDAVSAEHGSEPPFPFPGA